MYKHATSRIQAILYEAIAFREMLEQVLIVNIVNLDDFVGKAFEQLLIERQLQH